MTIWKLKVVILKTATCAAMMEFYKVPQALWAVHKGYIASRSEARGSHTVSTLIDHVLDLTRSPGKYTKTDRY
jgi:hypothetical protein